MQNDSSINSTSIQFQRTFKKLFCFNYFQRSANANCIDNLDSVLANLDNASISDVKGLINGNNPIVRVHALLNEHIQIYYYLSKMLLHIFVGF